MFCKNCGAELKDGASFCTKCGAMLSNNAAVPPVPSAPSVQGMADVKDKKGRKKRWWLPIVIIVLLGLIGTGAWFVHDRLSDRSELLYRKNNKVYKLAGREKSKLTSDVFDEGYGYRFLSGGKVLYYVDDNDLRLYLLGEEDGRKLAPGVSAYWVDENEESVVWLEEDGKLCAQKLDLGSDEEKIDSKAEKVEYISDDLQKIVYVRGDAVYVYTGSGDPVEVEDMGGDGRVMDTDGDIQIIWTERSGTDSEDLSLIIDDDMAEADAGKTAPRIEDYQHKEMKDSFWGLREATVTDSKYYEELEKYEEVQKRNEMREHLRDALKVGNIRIVSYSVKDDEVTELYDGPGTGVTSSDPNVLLYETYDLTNVKRRKLSELMETEYSDIQSEMEDILGSSVRLMMYNGKDSIALDTGAAEGSHNALIRLVDEESKRVYFTMTGTSDSNKTPLYVSDYSSNDGKVEIYTEDMDMTLLSYKGGAICLKDISGTTGDLYYGDEKIASDVTAGSVSCSKDGSIVTFYEHCSSDGSGDLCIYSGKKEKIANDVCDHRVNEHNDIAYLADYSTESGEGELKIYKNGKSTDVDDDVQKIYYY